MQVVVVGAGIIGLSCAHALAHRGHAVTMVAARTPMATTSAVAGASFKPRAVATGPLTDELLAASRRTLQDWDASGFARSLGIVRHRHVLATDGEEPDLPYADHVDDVERRSRDRGDDVVGGFRTSVSFRTWFFDVGRVLPALVDHLDADHDITSTIARLHRLADAADAGDVIVNATGLGARELVGDGLLEPIRGQAVRVPFADPPDWSVSADGAYAYPRRAADGRTGLFLGGTADVGSWDLEPDPGTTRRILADNARILPALADVDIATVESVVGLRPYRHGSVRVEVDRTAASTPVVHAYGHGGAGWTLATGTGVRVAQLVDRLGS